MHYAIENGRIEVFNTLLDKGADIHAADTNEKTPLHYAIENGKIEIFNTLLDK
ncbi:MAG: ankyrin repeat domain-containing protein [Rickettsiaceae bacterium]|nr:ankyrin repeat domain-containing protein [Rickettsiaceae bacterium]